MTSRRQRKAAIALAILMLLLLWSAIAVDKVWGKPYLGPWEHYPIGKPYACEQVIIGDYLSVKCVFEAERWYYFWNLSQANLEFYGYLYIWYNGDGLTATACTWNAHPYCARIPWKRK